MLLGLCVDRSMSHSTAGSVCIALIYLSGGSLERAEILCIEIRARSWENLGAGSTVRHKPLLIFPALIPVRIG